MLDVTEDLQELTAMLAVRLDRYRKSRSGFALDHLTNLLVVADLLQVHWDFSIVCTHSG